MEAPANEYKDAHDFVTQERNFSLLFNQITLFFLIKNEKTFFFFLATLHGMWHLNSLTRNLTHAPCIGSGES